MQQIIGRIEEKEILNEAYHSTESEMVAVLGRRRVGKTFLIKNVFSKMDFEFTGILNAPMNVQIENFVIKLEEFSGKSYSDQMPNTWLEAFRLLKSYLLKSKKKSKKIVFIDELPWLDTPKSKFTEALGYFWNDYALYDHIILVVCGSAASWMINKIVRNKGGLHNRITRRIELQPFTLKETELFLQKNNILLDRPAIAEIYMTMGGIPYYLKEIKKGESVAQNIDRICFTKNGLLYKEFKDLFASLYDNSETHILIIKALASKWKGLTRSEILKLTKLTDGGNITKVLEELEMSSFISITHPFAKKKKEQLYRIADFYSMFYLHFIVNHQRAAKGTFINMMKSPKWNSWKGYAFENICFYHLAQIEKKLGIQAIYSESSSFFQKGNSEKEGMQIDLLIDRADQIINICEIKFYDTPFIIKKDYAGKLQSKINLFKAYTQTKKTVLLCMISTFGTTKNIYSNSIVQNEIILNDLF